jgi:flagellar hook assembly protein FlgD
MDASELAGGDYSATLFFRSNDPATPVVPVTASLHVDGAVSMAAGTTVNAAAAIEIPVRYELHPNRPNPFNPTTLIAYDLPRAADVRLVIYDVQGRRVAELVNGAKPAGRHETTWNGRNASGEPVASGVYFYRLIAGDFVQTKKMVLLK